jgi:hypothetical protein
MDYIVFWELRKGWLHHFILKQMGKRKELIKFLKPISEPSSIMTKTTCIAYHHWQNLYITFLLPRPHNSPHFIPITGIIRKPSRFLPRNPRTQFQRPLHTASKLPMTEQYRLWKKPKTRWVNTIINISNHNPSVRKEIEYYSMWKTLGRFDQWKS